MARSETTLRPAKRRAVSAPRLGRSTSFARPARPLRPHALFPRAPGTGPEDRDIRWIGIWRKLSPAEALRAGFAIERSTRDYPADEILDWASIYERFGGGAYRVCAKDRKHRILCWASDGDESDEKWHFMSGRSKPLSHEDEEEDDDAFVPSTAPIATRRAAHLQRVPVARTIERTSNESASAASVSSAPATHVHALMQAQVEAVQLHMQIQAAAADRQMEMMMKMSQDTMALVVALLSKRRQSEAAAPSSPDPLEAVRLGMEIAKAQQAVAMPAPQPHPLEQLRTTIALMKDMRVLAPPSARSAPSDITDFQTEIDKLVGGLKAGLAPEMTVAAEGSQRPAVVLIDGRCLTIEAAAAEYARLMGEQPVETPAPVAAEPVAPRAQLSSTSVAAAGSDNGDAVVAEACANTTFAPSLAELIARSLRAAAAGPQAPEDPSSGGAASTSDSTAVSAGDRLDMIESRETSAAVSDAPDARDGDAGHASTEQHHGESPVPVDDVNEQAAIDELLRGDPAARAWLRAAVEIEPHSPLPERPADLGRFAEAVDVIREHPAGRAMLRAAVARAIRSPYAEASPPSAAHRDHVASPGPTGRAVIRPDPTTQPRAPDPPEAA